MPRPCFPPCARPAFPPTAAPSSSPPCAAATLPPFARPSPRTRGAAAPLWMPLASLGGMAAPASATAPPLARLGAACAGGWAPRRFLRLGWISLVPRLRDSLACASGVALGGHAGLCPSGKAARVKIGGVLRGVLPRSSAGFGWGRARECGTRQLAASPTPPPIRARATPSLTRVVRIRLTADFQRRLSVRAFQGHFSGSFGCFGG